jgi:hypothetical protein
MFSKIFLIGCVLAVAACAPSFVSRIKPKKPTLPTPDPRQELDERLRSTRKPAILFVGNSYSMDVPRAFRKIAADHQQPVRVGQSTYGGWTLSQHANHPQTLKKIRDGSWDVVVLQEYSRLPALPLRERESTMFPAILSLAKEIRAAGAIPVFYQTWGRRDGDRSADFPDDDFFAMNERLRLGYEAAAEKIGGAVIVPVGQAWAAEMRAGRRDVIFQQDGSHPTAEGNRLTAGVFFQTFFNP